MPANFKTYEAQARLLAAVLAANPAMKLDFKEIAKFFGESTPDGIQFQFRGIKKDAELLRKAVADGGSPASALSKSRSPAAVVTPAKAGRKRPASSAPAKTPSSATRTPKSNDMKAESDNDDDLDFEELEKTPTKPKKKPKREQNASLASGARPVGLPTTQERTPSEDDFTLVETPSQIVAVAAPAVSTTNGESSSQTFLSFEEEDDTIAASFMSSGFLAYGQFPSYENEDGEI